MQGYDLIGDVHGCGNTLRRLLEMLGYNRASGSWKHPKGRKVIFVGDILDRGPRIRQAMLDVYDMIEAGDALMVLGNHEYNALAYCTKNSQGEPLRSHSPRHNRVIKETLEQFSLHPKEWQELLNWFYTLPLALELEELRVVHACWDTQIMPQFLAKNPAATLTPDFLQASVIPGTEEFKLVDRCTRGTWLRLPEGEVHQGKDGFIRDRFRTAFWLEDPQTWGEVLFQPDRLSLNAEATPLSDKDKSRLAYYAPEERPLFFGHYWCMGLPEILRPNLTCLDYSAVKYGRLVAYRFNGEKQLNERNFVWVKVDPSEHPPQEQLRAQKQAEHLPDYQN